MNKESNNNKLLYLGLGALAILLLIVVIIVGVMVNNKNKELELPYTELINKINDNQIEKIEMTTGSQSIKVKLIDEEEKKNAIVPSVQAFIELVQDKVEAGN